MPTKNLRSIDNIDTNDMNFKHLEGHRHLSEK